MEGVEQPGKEDRLVQILVLSSTRNRTQTDTSDNSIQWQQWNGDRTAEVHKPLPTLKGDWCIARPQEDPSPVYRARQMFLRVEGPRSNPPVMSQEVNG